jgi:uncharacterized protein YjbI with pentapeptide repeats
MGQANAARDKLYDLRSCQLRGSKAGQLDLSGVIMSQTDASNVDFRESTFSKGYLHGTHVARCVWCSGWFSLMFA